MIVAAQFIVLDKRPYRESALLCAGISPDCGKMAFVIHGAQKITEKKFPEADLFRELDLEYDDDGQGKELYTARNVSLSGNFDTIADNAKHFKMAGAIGSFILKNSAPGLPQPYTYDSLRSVLSNLAGQDCGHELWSMEQCAVVIKTAFLYENGMLPEPQSEGQSEFLENLVASGIDNSPLPECNASYWRSLNNWLNSLIEFHHLKR